MALVAHPGRPTSEGARDVLAAEGFPVGSTDPVLHAAHALREPAHDVLAAEGFPVGGADAGLHDEHAAAGALQATGPRVADVPEGRPTPRLTRAVALVAAGVIALVGLLRRRWR